MGASAPVPRKANPAMGSLGGRSFGNWNRKSRTRGFSLLLIAAAAKSNDNEEEPMKGDSNLLDNDSRKYLP